MSLKVWLPLDGDLRNLGCSGVEVTNNGASINNSGKIGSCYHFGPSSPSFMTLPKEIMTSFTTECSVAFWLKIKTWNVSYATYFQAGLGSTPWVHYIFGFLRNSTNSTACFTISNGSSASNANYLTSTLELNKWYHVALTYKTGKCTIYLDGKLDHEYSTSIIPAFSSITHITLGACNNGSNYQTDCDMNDVRIYNHCLSAAEVREIAQGLVLHYKLDGGLFGNPNLLARYVVPGQAAPTSTANSGRTTWLGDYKITIPATENADTYFRLFMTEQLISGTTYTISCKVSGLLNGSYYKFPLFAQNNISMGVLNLDHNGLCSLTFTMNWTGTQTAATGANGETVYVNLLDDWARSLVSGQGAITLYDFKLEKGDAATTWCPADNKLAIDRTIVSDNSGYGHNGTINGALTISNDTPRYSFSNYMPKTTTITHSRPIYGGTDQEWTCCMWVKLDTTSQFGQQMNNFNLGNIIVHDSKGTPLLYLNNNTNDYYNYGNLAIQANTWTHIAFVFKNSNATKLIYINGVNHTNTNGPNKTSIPKGIPDIITVGTNLAGYISDYRIYCTALLDTDIKLLYKMGMRVDNLGGVHTFEYIEDEEEEKNTLQGLLKTNEIEEYNGIAKIKKNKGWLSPNFIEM